MSEFHSVRDTKTFLVAKLVEQAHRDGISLSTTEEKMLYFSETGWTIPDISDLSTAFDLEYDQGVYEDKIVGLIRAWKRYSQKHGPSDLNQWDGAVRCLRTEDHYLIVMIDIASSKALPQSQESSSKRFGKLMLMGGVGFIICAAVLMLVMWLKN